MLGLKGDRGVLVEVMRGPAEAGVRLHDAHTLIELVRRKERWTRSFTTTSGRMTDKRLDADTHVGVEIQPGVVIARGAACRLKLTAETVSMAGFAR